MGVMILLMVIGHFVCDRGALSSSLLIGDGGILSESLARVLGWSRGPGLQGRAVKSRFEIEGDGSYRVLSSGTSPLPMA